jgi:hypothetical protein
VTDAWQRLAQELGLPQGVFGDWAATEGMMHAAQRAMTAQADLDALERALHALNGFSGDLSDVTDRLRLEITACKHRLAAFPKSKRKRLDAYFVADKVAIAFKSSGRELTYGQMPDGSTPSTPFCRAVAMALQILEIDCGWRGPAREAWRAQNGEHLPITARG